MAADPVSSSQALSAILLCGLLGALGQGVRAVVGLKNAGSLNSTTPSSQTSFNVSYFVLSMKIGFIAGILAGIGLGLDTFVKLDLGNLKPLLGVIGSGYLGADFVENSLSLVLPGRPPIAAGPAVAAQPLIAPAEPLAPLPPVAPIAPPTPDSGAAAVTAALKIVCPRVNAGIWTPALITAFAKFGLTNNRRQAAAVGQYLVEAGSAFQELVENLHYSAQRASEVFPTLFPTAADAAPFVVDEQTFGNKVYANRLGNGDIASGDGFRFRGRGLIQLTGRNEYTQFGASVGKSADEASQYCETVEGAAVSAGWYLQTRGCLPLADSWDINEITRRVNGNAMEGAAQRLIYSNNMLKHLGG